MVGGALTGIELDELRLQRLQCMFEHVPLGIALIRVEEGPRFVFETVNPVSERLLGLTREQVDGHTPQELLPHREAERLSAHYRRCVESEQTISYEDARPDAPARLLQTTVIPARDAHGKVARIVALTRDITADRQNEDGLRASEERFAKAFRASPLAIGVTDLSSARILEVNEAFERTFRATREQVLGRSLIELGFWQNHADRLRMVELVRQQGAVRNYEIAARTRTGHDLTLLLSSERVEIRGVPCLVTFAQDVTEQRRAERALNEAGRAQAQLEAQLREAQKLEALGTLAGGIAHDFNNILGAIVAYSDLIKIEADDREAVLSHVGELKRASARAGDLVRQILTFSRRQRPERRAIKLESVVGDALRLLRSTLPATIEFDAQFDAATPVVFADSGQIHQIVMNLGTNAAHAIGARPGKLSVRLEGVDVSEEMARAKSGLRVGRAARLSVADSGRGMDAETLARIFEPFFTTKAPGEGTGLGLAVVHGIVSQHEGAIAVTSQPGLGSCFELHFPEHPSELREDAELRTELARGREHILLVEDESQLLRSVARLLERLGYRVRPCTTPFEALEAFAADPAGFDLVLTDLTMPGMIGVDMAREMLALRPSARIVVMSGFSASWDAETLRALGIADLLPKPITAQTLSAAVRKVLEAKLEAAPV